MKKVFMYLLLVLVVGGLATAGILGNITKEDDGTFKETKQVTVTQYYPSLDKLDNSISNCQEELDKRDALQELYDKSNNEIEKKALWDAITENTKCTDEELLRLQDLKNELSKVK